MLATGGPNVDENSVWQRVSLCCGGDYKQRCTFVEWRVARGLLQLLRSRSNLYEMWLLRPRLLVHASWAANNPIDVSMISISEPKQPSHETVIPTPNSHLHKWIWSMANQVGRVRFPELCDSNQAV
jgi:hypothetical protein